MKALAADLDALCRHMRAVGRVALAVHEKPDLDALGAVAGMLDLFAQMGTPATLCVAGGELLPFADFMLPRGVVERRAPAAGEVLYALDSGSLSRLALDLGGWRGEVVNIDHHHDNTRFGDLVLLRPEASSTSEIVCDVARALGHTPGASAATALYAGISFDTGHFRHANTGAATFATASWLVGLGVDVTRVYQELYERRGVGAVRLEPGDCRIGPERAQVDSRQQHVRRPCAGEERVVQRGGGGHVQAAGFSADGSPEEVTAWLSSALAKLLSTASS